MKRLCKNCESFAVDPANGVMRCERRNIELNEKSNPPIDSDDCWTRRPKLSGEELSRIRSLAGTKGGSKSGYGGGGTPTQQTCIRKMDHDILKGYAAIKGISLAETVHRLCHSLLSQYPDLKTDLWRD